jgi:phospholipid/cholesterol/gamma-HCH transport system substrate-binding protein
MHRNVIETIMGGVVLIVAVVFLLFAYTSSSTGTVRGYVVTAKFGDVSGINPGSDVRVSGIKIGSVVDAELDPNDYTALVTISLSDAVKLPTDSSALILADGLLGGSYLELQPGADEAMIEPGGQIPHTQDAINIIKLVMKFVMGGGLDTEGSAAKSSPQTQPQ